MIPIHWNDRTGTLTIDRHAAEFPAMHRKRQFALVLVKSGKNNGEALAQKAIDYEGNPVTVQHN